MQRKVLLAIMGAAIALLGLYLWQRYVIIVNPDTPRSATHSYYGEAQTVIAATAAVLALSGLLYSNIVSNENSQIQYSMNLLQKFYESPMREVAATIREHVPDGQLTPDHIRRRGEKQPDMLNAFRAINMQVGFMETLAVSIRYRQLNEEIVYQNIGQSVLKCYGCFWPYVHEARGVPLEDIEAGEPIAQLDSKVYEHLLWLVRRWGTGETFEQQRGGWWPQPKRPAAA